MPRLGICEFTTMNASFDEDLAAYRAAGVEGIGVCEAKIAGDTDAGRRLRESGLAVSICVPAVPSILPLPLMPGPDEPKERVEAICASLSRLAELEPACVLFLTGPGPERREVVVEGVRRIAAEAGRAGVRAALEPIHLSQRDEFSFVNTFAAAAALLDEAEADSVGLLFDTWNLWDSPGLDEQIRTHAGRIAGVHVADRREPTRSHFDRVLPGAGVAPIPAILRALDDAGYDGWYDVEIFSDDISALDPGDVARRCRESFDRAWEAR